jgi:hypothetical protein
MHPLIRFAAALILLFLAALSVMACPRSSNPVQPFSHHHRQIATLIDLLPDSGRSLIPKKNSGSVSEKSSETGVRICSCQVLNLQSSNHDHRYVVLLAEKQMTKAVLDLKRPEAAFRKKKTAEEVVL